MVATVQIGEINGPTATPVFSQKDTTTIRFKEADNATVDNVNPLVIPTAGSKWSYTKQTRFKVTVAPSVSIGNTKFYTDGANGFGTGVEMKSKLGSTSYLAPVQETTTPTGGAAFTNSFTFTSGAVLAINTGTFSGTGEKGNHVNHFMKIGTTATQGATPQEVGTYSYDEI